VAKKLILDNHVLDSTISVCPRELHSTETTMWESKAWPIRLYISCLSNSGLVLSSTGALEYSCTAVCGATQASVFGVLLFRFYTQPSEQVNDTSCISVVTA